MSWPYDEDDNILTGKRRYVSCNWDLAEVETAYKAKILEKDALVNKLSIP